jgi:hypothetical protein
LFSANVADLGPAGKCHRRADVRPVREADAARRLGIQRRLLCEKMKALGMESSE